MGKRDVNDLAWFGAAPLFDTPKSTSNLVQPEFDRFLAYAHPGLSAPGSVAKRFETRLAEFHDTEYCVSFCSGFWALAVTMVALARPGRREVVMPSLTYRRMADVVAWTGLLPRFCEVDEHTLAISADTAKACIGDDTALLLGVHPIVNCCDVEGLGELARQHDLPLMFDAVESVFETVKGGKIGRFGDAEVFSLHASKLINGFEGGYVTTQSASLAAKLFALRDGKGSERGAIDARLDDTHAAMALANLDDLEAQVERNRTRYLRYRDGLRDLQGVRLLNFDDAYPTSYKNIVVELLDDWQLSRSLTVEILNAERILARVYYWPALHTKPMAYPHIAANLPLTEELSKRFVLLPCGDFVTLEDIDACIALLSFLHRHAAEIVERAESKEQG
ncbi:DegT/DnrJ/EryC1/StrS aminotransferase family protein [Paraburkholderia bannensis]|uniref:DegT/DnrJ/EryC1/StrS aminotransferase family protein n=1 Tax=Paraburkholderia bannensis TaxID=765414 RepID=UPI002AB61E04|nr:DegT/DnrJ/EryC1/StrS aminotransferase family protein [Paraburkholderia bannensis]